MTLLPIVILLSLTLGFALSWLPLKIGISGAILLPFIIVFAMNLFWELFASTSNSGAAMAEVAYFTVALPGVVIALIALWLSRKFFVRRH